MDTDYAQVKCNACQSIFNAEVLPFKLKDCPPNCVYCFQCLPKESETVHCLICNSDRKVRNDSDYGYSPHVKSALDQFYTLAINSHVCKKRDHEKKKAITCFHSSARILHANSRFVRIAHLVTIKFI